MITDQDVYQYFADKNGKELTIDVTINIFFQLTVLLKEYQSNSEKTKPSVIEISNAISAAIAMINQVKFVFDSEHIDTVLLYEMRILKKILTKA